MPTLPTAPSLIMWGTTAANNIYRLSYKMGSKYPQKWTIISRKKLIPDYNPYALYFGKYLFTALRFYLYSIEEFANTMGIILD